MCNKFTLLISSIYLYFYRMKTRIAWIATIIGACCLNLRPKEEKTCDDWGFYAHRKLNELAVYTLPPRLMRFFKDHMEEIQSRAVDPDKRRYAVRGEAVRHYIDLDHWGTDAEIKLPREQAKAIWRTAAMYWIEGSDSLLVFDTTNLSVLHPAHRKYSTSFLQRFIQYQGGVDEESAIRWMRERAMPEYDEFEWLLNLEQSKDIVSIPGGNSGRLWIDDRFSKHGILPYFFPQHYRRLVRAFESGNTEKIIRLAADLGHYVGDAHVPLHTSKNYNGQLSNQDGIHAFWESRIPELFAEEEFDFVVGPANFIGRPEEFIWKVIGDSHRGVELVLRMEKELSAAIPADRQYCYEERLGVVSKLPCKDYARSYHERLDYQVESRFQACIASIGSVWFSAWTEAGQPDLSAGSMTGGDVDEKGKVMNEKQRAGVRIHE